MGSQFDFSLQLLVTIADGLVACILLLTFFFNHLFHLQHFSLLFFFPLLSLQCWRSTTPSFALSAGDGGQEDVRRRNVCSGVQHQSAADYHRGVILTFDLNVFTHKKIYLFRNCRFSKMYFYAKNDRTSLSFFFPPNFHCGFCHHAGLQFPETCRSCKSPKCSSDDQFRLVLPPGGEHVHGGRVAPGGLFHGADGKTSLTLWRRTM